jgi:hypothetical protein
MNRLQVQMVRKLLQEHDEGIFNQQFPIELWYHIVGICSLELREPIPEVQATNQMYQSYRLAIARKNRAKEIKYLRMLKKQKIQTENIVKKFLDLGKTINIEENQREEVWTKTTIGYLAHEEN